jgi:hypothetical protein
MTQGELFLVILVEIESQVTLCKAWPVGIVQISFESMNEQMQLKAKA